MKRILMLPLFLFSINALLAQDYLEKVAKDICECSSKIEENENAEDIKMKLGVCMINMTMPYKKQIKKDLKIDLDNMGPEEWEQFGRVVGVKMAGYCPEFFLKMYKDAKARDNASELPLQIDTPDDAVSGVITKIEEGNFIVFSLKDDKGKVIKLYWLDFISSDIDLITDYTSLLDKAVEVSYTRRDYFDSKIKEYRQFYVITKLNLN